METAHSIVPAAESRSSPAPWGWLNELAAELHDGPVQIVTAVLMRLSLVEEQFAASGRDELQREIRQLGRLLGTAIDEMRSVCADVRLSGSSGMEPMALIRAATRAHAARFGKRMTPVRLSLQQHGVFQGRMSPGRRHCLSRFVQEALSNAERHAGAAGVVVAMREERDRVLVRVCDDGAGMPRSPSKEGQGLDGMTKRIALQGGRLHVSSALGVGTCLSLVFVDQRHGRTQ